MSLPGGYPMPGFTLPLLNAGLLQGDTTLVRSTDLDGKVVILAFWATWCAPCIREQPSLLALQEEFSDDGLEVYGVLYRDTAERALDWLKKNDRMEFRTLVGNTGLAKIARANGVPVTLLVDRSGTVAEIYGGYWPERDPYMREHVRRLLRQPGR